MPRQRQHRRLAGRHRSDRQIGDRVEQRVDPLAGLRRYRKFARRPSSAARPSPRGRTWSARSASAPAALPPRPAPPVVEPQRQVRVARPAAAPAGRLPARPDPPCREFPRYRPGSPDSPGDRAATSIGSRVVPANGEVIATSRPAIAFISVDLPTFGGPAITTTKPERSRSADCALASARSIRSTARPRRLPDRLRRQVRGVLDVGKVELRLDRRHRVEKQAANGVALRAAARRPRSAAPAAAAPRSPPRPDRRAPRPRDRSILPFRKARQANSPGSASRSPGDDCERPRQRRGHGPAAGDVQSPPRPRR